jgi:uncharacterized membrane protein
LLLFWSLLVQLLLQPGHPKTSTLLLLLLLLPLVLLLLLVCIWGVTGASWSSM